MTPEAQQKAIAEACGWEMIWESDIIPPMLFGKDPKRKRAVVPDYLNNLNAMHEAEQVLTEDQYLVYVNLLRCMSDEMTVRDAVRSSADFRAEAFLRTLGLWKD